MISGKMKRNFLRSIIAVGLLIAAMLPAAALADDQNHTPSDGVDFDSIFSSKSSVFLGAYDHASSVTYGASGGVQLYEGTARPILWNVVGKDGKTLTLLSNYVIDAMNFNSSAVSGSFNYPSSSISSYLPSQLMLSGFVSSEKSPEFIPSNDISTSIYDEEDATLLDSQNISGFSWPLVKSSAQLYLPWARTMTDYSDSVSRLYYSINGKDASSNISAIDIQANLRSSLSTAEYWTRSPHLEKGIVNPPNNESLYVNANGKIKISNVSYVYGLRPMATVDSSRVLLARKISDSAYESLELASDATLNLGAVSADGNYYSADKGSRGASSENYKLTIISDDISLTSLSTTEGKNINADGSTGISVSKDEPLELSAVTSGATNGMGYKIVKTVGSERKIVSCGKADTYTFNLPLVGLDMQSPLAAGEYTVYVWAGMSHGINSDEGSNPISFTLNIDAVSPVTSITPAPDDKWKNSDITVTFNATDNASEISELHIAVNDGNELILQNQNSYSLMLSSEGIHKVSYWAVDAAGNAETKKEATFAIDKTAPLTSATAPGTYSLGKITLSSFDPSSHAIGKQSSGIDKTYYSINNGTKTIYNAPIELKAAGSYLIQYWAEDIAGNTEATKVAQYIIKDPPAKISLSTGKRTMQVGGIFKPSVTISPASSSRELLWTSSNSKIANVTHDGSIVAVSPGRAYITAKGTFGDAKGIIEINVEDNVTSIEAAQKTVYMTKGKTVKLPVVCYTKKDSNVTLNWKSKKYGAATIVKSKKDKLSAKGQVSAKSNKNKYIMIKANNVGTTKITLTSLNKKKIDIKVVVKKKAPKFKADNLKIASIPKGKRLETKKTARLKLKLKGMNTSYNKIVKWKSSKPKVIRVDQTGKITALKSGKATITVSVGKKKAKVKITSVRWGK